MAKVNVPCSSYLFRASLYMWMAIPLVIQAAEPSKDKQIDDDFHSDPRSVYLTAGELEWKKGLLTLKSGATLAFSNEAGPTAKVSVTLDGISHTRNEASETRVGFLI